MNRNLLFLVIGLVGGLLLAFLFLMIASQPEVEKGEVYFGGEEVTAALERLSSKFDSYQEEQKRTLAELAGEIAGLKAEMRDLREGGEIRVAKETEEGGIMRERIPPAPQEIAEKLDVKQGDSGWVSVLDKDLARVLVEAGLTPFDHGVSPLLMDASAKMREEERQSYDNRRVIENQYPNKRAEEYRNAHREVTSSHYKKRREITDTFRASLAALKAEKQAKKKD